MLSGTFEQELTMNKTILGSALAIALLALPLAANAQQGGAAAGAATGAVTGAVVGGPVGAVVGGVAGAAVGGSIEANERPRFREYVGRERHPSYRYSDEVRVGSRLPGSGVTYYDVPAEYGVKNYRYTIVNDRTVLVDPRTGEIVEVLD
jgi:hypothetical protein